MCERLILIQGRSDSVGDMDWIDITYSDSDNDDVVMIKEEIEVDDGDDVIFLSETKAAKQTEVAEAVPADSTESPQTDEKVDLTSVSLSRNDSVCSSFDSQLSLTDQTVDSALQTTVMAPLDLSAKVSDTSLQFSRSTSDLLQTDSAIQGLLDSSGSSSSSCSSDTLQLQQSSMPEFTSNPSGNKSPDLVNFSVSASTSDLIAQCFSQASTDFLMGISHSGTSLVTASVSQSGCYPMAPSFNHSGSDLNSNQQQQQQHQQQQLQPVLQHTDTQPGTSNLVLGFSQSDPCLHQGGVIQSKQDMNPLTYSQPNSFQAQSDNVATFSAPNPGCSTVGFSQVDNNTSTENSPSRDSNNLVQSVPSSADDSFSFSTFMICNNNNNNNNNNNGICNNNNNTTTNNNNLAININSTPGNIFSNILSSTISSSSSMTSSYSVPLTSQSGGGQCNSLSPSVRKDSSPNSFSFNVGPTLVPQCKPVMSDSSNVLLSQLLSTPAPVGARSHLNNAACAQPSDQFTDSHKLLRSLYDPCWSSSTSSLDTNPFQNGATTNTVVSSPSTSGSQTANPQVIMSVQSSNNGCTNSGLPLVSPRSPSVTVAPTRYKMSPTSVCRINAIKRSLSLFDEKTYCKKKKQGDRHWSALEFPLFNKKKLSGQKNDQAAGGNNSSCCSDSGNVGDVTGSSVKHQLPPKKQRRCFSQEGDTSSQSSSVVIATYCACCSNTLTGEKFSQCPNGHKSCAKCLEERAKLVLTGKNKESVRCLSNICDSFYPISELKQTLPSMVVEILEDKLEQDHVNLLSDMILKNSTGEITQTSESDTVQMEELPPPPPPLLKYQQSIDGDLPESWEQMEESEGYRMVNLDCCSDEYNQVLLKFYDSMTDPKVDVINIKRVQNPIQWKFYKVKKMQMLQENDGFSTINEMNLFHGTTSSIVEAICKKGFDWRVCGKNGTLYGQGSYFALNASYSHQYTDIKERRRMTHAQPSPPNQNPFFNPIMSSQLYPQFLSGTTALNLSHNPPTVNSPTATTPCLNANRACVVHSVNVNNPTPSTSTTPHSPFLSIVRSANNTTLKWLRYRPGMPSPILNRVLSQPGSGDQQQPGEESNKLICKVFLARVLVGKFVGGNSRLRKPPPLNPKLDPFGKCYDSCVDNVHLPKLFVIFDSAQAYPEYLIEYTCD